MERLKIEGREVYIIDDIGNGVTASSLIEAVKDFKDEKIILHIYSFGGSLIEALAFYDYATNNNLDIDAYVYGIAASAATVIASTGRVFIGDNSYYLIHDPFVEGIAEPETIERLEIEAEKLARIYAKKTGRSSSEMRAVMKEDRLLSPQEALSLGLVDSIVSEGRIAASLKEMLNATDEEIDQRYKDFRNEVNMSASEVERWGQNDCSKLGGVDNGRTPRNRVIKLLRTPKAEWGANEFTEAGKVVSYLSRAKKITGGEIQENCNLTINQISLKNWGFDPKKTRNQMQENDWKRTGDDLIERFTGIEKFVSQVQAEKEAEAQAEQKQSELNELQGLFDKQTEAIQNSIDEKVNPINEALTELQNRVEALEGAKPEEEEIEAKVAELEEAKAKLEDDLKRLKNKKAKGKEDELEASKPVVNEGAQIFQEMFNSRKRRK